mgnify:CR=1 FL=1|tara:strand:- start:302 stop:1117 length:816 start_codon:yes stop_codon:yes gene_type:complete
MNNLSIFCLSLNPDHLKKIKELNYIPVGLGEENFNKEWITDKDNINISQKNNYYGEYTFHYWLWKNYINELPKNWIGFCQYRKFWVNETIIDPLFSFQDLKNVCLKTILNEDNNYESIIGEPFYVNKFKLSKFIKKGLPSIILNPTLLFNKNKRTIKFHFDLMHGKGNIDKAIALLDEENRDDFKKYINTNISFHPHNMFICKSKKILISYYETIFPWLLKCENEFGFKTLKGYGMQRIYGFLAERFMSYWFKKNTKYKIMPIYFKDLSDF